jgi:hypothetical protein
MSFKVDKGVKLYHISIGTGKTYTANNLQEVVYALQHFFRESIPQYPFEFHNINMETKQYSDCPFCRK